LVDPSIKNEGCDARETGEAGQMVSPSRFCNFVPSNNNASGLLEVQDLLGIVRRD
jgi:hypothetical protein